jgi:hypothetical protein
MPQSEYFKVKNTFDREFELHSIVSNNLQFHPVFSTPKILLPNEIITIEIVFFPYYVETARANITLSSSIGEYNYNIVGHAIQNPHNLHPFTGMKLIGGSSYEQPIVIFNPYSDTLYIREIYTSEDFLTLLGNAISTNAITDSTSSTSTSVTPNHMKSSISTDLSVFQVSPGHTTEVIRVLISASTKGNMIIHSIL